MFVIDVPDLSLEKIYAGPQMPRWKRLTENKFVLIDGKQVVKVNQYKDKLFFGCSEDDFFNHWVFYLDIHRDYYGMNKRLMKQKGLKQVLVRAKGLRFVNSDLFETIVTQMLLLNLESWRARYLLEMIIDSAGEQKVSSMAEAGKTKWKVFPTADAILRFLEKVDEDKLLGKFEMLRDFCEDVTRGYFNLDALENMSYEEAKESMIETGYFTESLAENVCLYGLNFKEANIIDSRYEAAIEELSGLGGDLYDEIFLQGLKKKKAYVKSCILWNYLNPPKKMEEMSSFECFR